MTIVVRTVDGASRPFSAVRAVKTGAERVSVLEVSGAVSHFNNEDIAVVEVLPSYFGVGAGK